AIASEGSFERTKNWPGGELCLPTVTRYCDDLSRHSSHATRGMAAIASEGSFERTKNWPGGELCLPTVTRYCDDLSRHSNHATSGMVRSRPKAVSSEARN
ncbi:hypothetical protein ACIBI3_12790, partial [Actinomadura luteofluorescens]|uniref:hypothetical protein n=1 Tax=Actinomadura luteofluorescens TaxID=46163 RepID=UPI003496FDD1